MGVTLRGSPAGFDSRRDLIIRRTPMVKLKMNVEITIDEFNGANFQTNLAILLGIPPERIKVVAVAVRRLRRLDERELPQENQIHPTCVEFADNCVVLQG